MKRSLVLLAFAVVGGSVALGEHNIQDNQILVRSVIQAIGEKAINAFPDPAPILGLLETKEDFRTLCKNGAETWRASLADLPAIAPDRASRLVLLHSYLYLPPKEYMECLTRVLHLLEEGKLPKDEVAHIFMMPPRDENCWFLSYNSNEPEMVKFLERTRSLFAQDKDMKRLIDFISSGKARVRDERLRRGCPGTVKRSLPLLREP